MKPTLTHISWKATGYQTGGNNFFGLPVKAEASMACPLLSAVVVYSNPNHDLKEQALHIQGARLVL